MGENREHDRVPAVVQVHNTVFGADALMHRFLKHHIPWHQPTSDPTIGVRKNGKLVAAVAYSDFNGAHMIATIAAVPGSGWADRTTLFTLFAYPFIQMECKAITVLVAASNPRSLNLATKLGFKGEAIVTYAAHDGTDLLVLKMKRGECRWLRHGQQQVRKRTGRAEPGDHGPDRIEYQSA
ncbi:MAG: hypothetical protein AAGI03_01865 [Pseudomonadota bacterium]